MIVSRNTMHASSLSGSSWSVRRSKGTLSKNRTRNNSGSYANVKCGNYSASSSISGATQNGRRITAVRASLVKCLIVSCWEVSLLLPNTNTVGLRPDSEDITRLTSTRSTVMPEANVQFFSHSDEEVMTQPNLPCSLWKTQPSLSLCKGHYLSPN